MKRLASKSKNELIQIIHDCIEYGKVHLCNSCLSVCVDGCICPECDGEEQAHIPDQDSRCWIDDETP